MVEWDDASLPLERTLTEIVPLTITCVTNESVTTPGVAVMNLDDEMFNHANIHQLIHERIEPLRNQCNLNDIRNRTNEMGAVTTYLHKPPCATDCQPQHDRNMKPLPNLVNPKSNHTNHNVNPVTHHHPHAVGVTMNHNVKTDPRGTRKKASL